MAINPLYNTNDTPNGATQPSKAVNDMQVFVNRNRNTFDLSYFNYKTQRFGQYEPFFVMEGVPGDTIPLHSSHQVRSLPMMSPFLSSLTLSKDYFMIPMQSILPNTWEMIFTNPASGDDVPDDCNCVLPLGSITVPEYSDFEPNVESLSKIKMIMAHELLFSNSSLLTQLGFSTYDNRPFDGFHKTFDDAFDKVLRDLYLSGAVAETSKETVSKDNCSLGAFVDFLRFNFPELTSFKVPTSVSTGLLSDWAQANDFVFTTLFSDIRLNISRILAYQLVCQQFYVNTKVDAIYNAQIYRDNFYYLLDTIYLSEEGIHLPLQTFSRNGINIPYDFFSEHYFSLITANCSLTSPALADVVEYIFGIRRVLKFGDYFTSCRTQPLGTDVNGQMNAPVVGDKVAAIDMSKSIVMQRFLNNVVKLGNDFGEYLRGIFGTEPSPDYHFPKFISHQEFNVSGFEVSNTTNTAQGNQVTNLNTNDDKFAFEVRVDMPCIILGISNFNCPRVYLSKRNRFFFHYDRFDMFNPMLQYIGDQPVLSLENSLSPSSPDEVYGYQSRNAEYKQNYSVASGGFVDKLPSWAFVPDYYQDADLLTHFEQNSDAIRVYPFEFDKFFSTLSGQSLANGFHFIVVYNNKVMASRPMAVNPSIL